MISSDDPPHNVSVPEPAIKLYFPAPALFILITEVVLALAVSFAVPVACSFLLLLVATKLKTFIAFKVAFALTTKTSPVVRSLTVSSPLSILKVSFPVPPVMMSSPAPPVIVSWLSPVLIVSTSLPPVMKSLPAPPVMVKVSS